jgi:predicted alpha/beta superfamily hydrolase
MKKFYLLFLCPIISLSQVTLKVVSIPANTPEGATIYFAGSVNSWNPGDANYIVQLDEFGNRQIVIPEGTGTVSYKFTRGSWATVEGNASGGFTPDRTFTFTGSPQTIELSILSWEDLGGGSNSTAAANVQIMDGAFYMPQLDTTRRIWLYLPPDYDTTTKNYPVLYMQDGQNLFDNATSFSGEWEVDETLNELFADGDYGVIVVGIDNGGAERLNEYSPWVNDQYGGGDGDDYMSFLANTLKPYIDSNYRTRPEAAMNALIGSSMGGLISTYGACEFPNAFSKVGSLSPAYWFALSDLNDYIDNGSFDLSGHRMYFVGGTNESSTMVSHINTVKDKLQAKGLTAENTLTKFDSYGTHTESYWRGEFAALYQWLFAEENLAVSTPASHAVKIIQTLSGKLFVSGISNPTDFNIISITGQKIQTITLSDGIFELPDNLSNGIYLLQNANRTIEPQRFIKN